jgi:TetR/AcrR family transcriptional regulator
MVSQKKPVRRPGSRERLLQAAAAEFAARGFDGAKVERITRRARVNKAMLYYHFDHKAALYREILGHQFTALAAAVAAGHDADAAPDRQLRRFIHIVADVLATEPHFPAIWLREMAEGGRHLDASIAVALKAIIAALGRILEQGRRDGLFVPAHPLVTQMGIVGPLLLFAASAPARERFGRLVPGGFARAPREVVIAHVEAATLAALAPPSSARPPTAAPSSRRPRS